MSGTTIALVALAAIPLIAVAFLALRLRYRASRGHYGMYFLFKRLRTTPGQEQVIRTALLRLRDAGRQLASETKGARPDLAKMVRGEDFDETGARSWFASRERAFEDIKPELIASLREIHGVLDSDQRGVLGDALESGRIGWGRHHRHRYHRGACC